MQKYYQNSSQVQNNICTYSNIGLDLGAHIRTNTGKIGITGRLVTIHSHT